MMLAKFRDRYPQGSLVSKLVQIDRGNFIVKVSVKVENITLVTALAGASNVEAAEDAARTRAIEALCLEGQTTSPSSSSKLSKQITSVEFPQTQVENIVRPERKGTLTNNKATRLAEMETANQSSANFAVANTSTDLFHTSPQSKTPELEIATARSAPDSSNLFEGTFTPPSDASPAAEHQNVPIQEAEELTSVSFELANQPSSNPATDIAPKEIQELSTDFDFTQVKQKTDIEITRLGWTRDDGREFLQSRYGKRSRLHLKDEELQEFLSYLEQQPTPVN